MIKNIIFDVGMVLVNWDPHAAFQELGFDEKTEEAVGNATVYSDAWNESDRSVLDAEEQLAVFVQNAPEYEKEIRLFWENVARAIYQYDYSRAWIRELKQKGYHVYILSNYGAWTYAKTKDQSLGFLKDVDGALFSFEVKQIKPEPEIYHSLLERFHLRAEECVFLDDRQNNVDGAIACGIVGLGCDFTHQLCAHVLELILQLDLFCNGHAIVGDDRCAELFAQHHVAALGAEGNLNGVSQGINTGTQCLAGVLALLDLLCHNTSLLYNTSSIEKGKFSFSLPQQPEYHSDARWCTPRRPP